MGRERRRKQHPLPLQKPARLPGLYSFTLGLKVAEANNALALKKGLEGKEISISGLRIKAVSKCKFTFPLSNHYVFTSISTQWITEMFCLETLMVGVGSQQPTHSNGSRREVPEEPIKRSWIFQEQQLHQPIIAREITKQERSAEKKTHFRRRGRQRFSRSRYTFIYVQAWHLQTKKMKIRL